MDVTALFDSSWYLHTYPFVADSGKKPLEHYLETGFKEGLNPHPLFDSNWYRSVYADVAQSGINPLIHYIEFGVQEGRNPNPLFDSAWYVNTYPEVKDAGQNPLLHYIDVGSAAGYNPNPLFHSQWYWAVYTDVSAHQVNPLAHFLQYGTKEKRNPNPLFFTAWYLEAHPDVAASGIHPLTHFLIFGSVGHHNPNPLFDVAWYMKTYPDAAQSGVNPLDHFFQYGSEKGYDPNPLFDMEWYLKTYPDVAQSDHHPLAHFLEFGSAGQHSPSPLFDAPWYLQAYPDAAQSGLNPLDHFFSIGAQRGYQPNPLFHTDWYRSTYPDVAESDSIPLLHYLTTGTTKAYNPNPLFDTSFYRDTYPEVAESGTNPLTHFLLYGHSGAYNPNVFFDAKWYLRTHAKEIQQGENPLAHYFRMGLSAGFAMAPPRKDPSNALLNRLILEEIQRRQGASTDIGLNVLFVLHASQSSNSGYQVRYLATHLVQMGVNCLIAVPAKENRPEYIGDERICPIYSFRDIEAIGLNFNNGRGPDIVHAWTPRECVRRFCHTLERSYAFTTLIHLEDNEVYLTEKAVGRKWSELTALSEEELDQLIPVGCYHPTRGRKWLEKADGLTMVIDTLETFNVAGVPSLTVPPLVDERLFYSRPINVDLRKKLNIPDYHLVLAYTGNTHEANEAEIRELYRAVSLLNQKGCKTTLLRTGKHLKSWEKEKIENGEAVASLGWVQRRELPGIQAAADIFVQPGSPGAFNDFRVPCKLPEFFSLGRPVILPRCNWGLEVQHGVQAFVLDHATGENIADAILQLREDEALQSRLAYEGVSFFRGKCVEADFPSRLSAFYLQIKDNRFGIGEADQPSIAQSIMDAYRITLGRIPDVEEVAFWSTHFENGGRFHEFLAGLVSPEQVKTLEVRPFQQYKQLLPDVSNAEFVQHVFEILLGRGVLANEIDHWRDQMEQHNRSRVDILVSLFETAVTLQKERAKNVDVAENTCRVLGTNEFFTLSDWKKRSRMLKDTFDVQSFESGAEPKQYRHRFSLVDKKPRVLVSAIASLYRGGAYIEQFMANITGQDGFSDYCELVIVDADSPENEYEVIQPFLARFNNIQYIRCNYRIGIYEAWNIAAKAAKGKYLTNTNLDDLRRHDSFLLQAAVLDHLPFVDVVYQDFHYTFDSSLTVDEVALFGVTSNLPVITMHNLMAFNSPHNAPMWRKRLHDELGYFNPQYRSAGDSDFWMRCLQAGKTFYKLNDPHIIYYQNPDGISTQPGSRGLEESLQILKTYHRKLMPEEVVVSKKHLMHKLATLSGGQINDSDERYNMAQQALRNVAKSLKYAKRKSGALDQ